MKKSAFWVSDQATRKPARLCLEISDLDSIAIILLRQRRKAKVLIRLRGCAGWSASLLFAYGIKKVFSWRGSYEPPHDKTNKMTVRPAKTQISLGIRPVWSESPLCAEWVGKDPSFLHADSEYSDQTERMRSESSLGAHAILLVLSWGGSIMLVAYWSHVSWHCFHNEVLTGLSKYTDIWGLVTVIKYHSCY